MGLEKLPDVDLDPSGTFKYILIQATDKATKEQKYIVRGYGRCGFHTDILDEAAAAAGKDFKLKCLGGGRIRHDATLKDLFVYGYSQGFGRADHQITVDILKKSYPAYSVTFSNDGY